MTQQLVQELESFFKHEANGRLRSILVYEEDDHEIRFLRDDIADKYSPHEIEHSLDDSRMESIFAPTYADIFSEDHGELVCLVKYFENAVEMNFVVSDGVGVAVGLDDAILTEMSSLLAEANEMVADY